MSTAPFMPPERRATIVAMYVQSLSLSYEDATMIVDLATHATQKAAEASALVAQSAPSEAFTFQVLMLAAQLIEEQCAAYIAGMRQMAQNEGVTEIWSEPT